ncbi:MAG TPA: AI-2E family transporter [Anaerolineales bacterium]
MYRSWDTPFRYIVLATFLVLSVALLWYARAILQPLLGAAIIAYVLSPGADLLMRRFHLSRKTAAMLVYFATLAVLLLLVGTLVPVMLDQVNSVRTDLQSALTDLQTWLASPIQFGLLRLDLRLLEPPLAVLVNTGPIVPQPSQALRFIEMTSRGVIWTLVVLVTVYYLMADWDELRSWVIGLAPPSEQADLSRLYLQIRTVWQQYLRGQLRLIVILAIIYSAAWEIIGVPGALALGLLAGFLNLVPELGPAAIGIIATIVAYLEGSNVFGGMSNILFAALTLGVYLLINTFKSVWLQPRILGRSVLLHEGLVFVAIVAALVLSGVLGVLVVVPVLASGILVGKYVRRKLLGLPLFDDESSRIALAAGEHGTPAGNAESSAGKSELAPTALPKKNPR